MAQARCDSNYAEWVAEQATMIGLPKPPSASCQFKVNRIGAGSFWLRRAGPGGSLRQPESEVCYPRRTPQNSGNIDFTISLMSERNAVGWKIWPSGM